MHISDGVLPISITVGSYAASAALAAWSVRRTRSEELPKVAVVTAAFFVASLIHVPFGPTSVHLLIPGLAGALLGPSAFLAIGLGLLLQSILFQFGGLTALGANALMMGVPALACGVFFQKLKGQVHGQWAALRGLDDDRVASSNSIRQKPEGDHAGEVEGRNDGNNADRLPDHQFINTAGDILRDIALH